jgi:HAD superfamily hydrolase (TIGR01509 family)
MSTHQVIDEWLQLALHQYERTIELKDGAVELLEKLSGMGVKLAVATACFPAACEALLRRHGVRERFSVIVYSDDIKRGKAFPDLWLDCAEKLQVPPCECIVFEDFPTAASGVRAAGMGLVAVYENSFGSSFQGDWQAFSAKADIAVKSLRELL